METTEVRMTAAYPLNMVRADRWKRISVEVAPKHTPLIDRVQGSGKKRT